MSARWKTLLTPEIIAGRTARGEWDGMTIARHLDRLYDRRPDQLVVVDGGKRIGAAMLRDMAQRLLAALQARGVRPGDVVSFQLPNWHEAILVELACAYGGLVCNPIVSIYRDAEVAQIAADARPRFLFVPHVFRRFDHAAMVDRIGAGWKGVTETIVVRPEGGTAHTGFEELMAEASGAPRLPAVDANDVKLLMYTSGTTGRAKGVLHTHNTIGAEVRNFIGHLGLDAGDVILMPSPLGHITGYLYGMEMPITLGCPVVLMDVWDVARAADLIDAERASFVIGATPFLQELARYAEEHDRRMPTLRHFPSGGAPVPPEIIRHANRAFANCTAFRVYGSTEAPTVSLGVPDRAREHLGATTEGFVVGHEIRLADPEGRTVEPGEEGEVLSRGPENFVGYTNADDNAAAFDAEGYFRTGDLARMTPEGCLVITGRAKDLIIRGGENISPKEIEDVIYTHPAVREAAVVAMPHPRLGETACAFVTLRPGGSFDFAAMEEVLNRSGLARQKFPERLELVEALPYTAAGKVRKNVLRDEIRARLAAGAEQV
jgi:acyl-CoA synthetase (AMP-forming)/AMP-acid ligase II